LNRLNSTKALSIGGKHSKHVKKDVNNTESGNKMRRGQEFSS